MQNMLLASAPGQSIRMIDFYDSGIRDNFKWTNQEWSSPGCGILLFVFGAYEAPSPKHGK